MCCFARGADRPVLARLEAIGWLRGGVKLANVAAAMAWGFIVTFVFVRLLPIDEFRVFLVLIAFANFTISADFGFSGIIYARLRRWRLGEGGDFDPVEIVALAGFMAMIVALGAVAIAAALGFGLLPTAQPGLFLAFYALSALNIFTFLARRAMAALDHNVLWESVDFVRRIAAILLLLAALWGMPILLSIALQAGLMVAALMLAGVVVQRTVGMRTGDWLNRLATGPRGLWARNRGDMRATMLLTLSDVAAYNAPYFTIAAATADPRPLLLFDFGFKISRALTAVIRALVETALPGLTRAFHGADRQDVGRRIARLRHLGLASAAVLALLLLIGGQQAFAVLYDGKAVPSPIELSLIGLLLIGLTMLCLSTYIQQGIGRFQPLVPPSLAFLTGSVLSVLPARFGAPAAFAPVFLATLALVHCTVALRHEAMLRGLVRP